MYVVAENENRACSVLLCGPGESVSLIKRGIQVKDGEDGTPSGGGGRDKYLTCRSGYTWAQQASGYL